MGLKLGMFRILEYSLEFLSKMDRVLVLLNKKRLLKSI